MDTRRRPHSRPRPRRAGFSLIELLVATVALTVGVLALAGTAVSISRLERHGARYSLAAAAAESRLEMLRAERCMPRSGENGIGAMVELWEVLPVGGGVHELVESVRIASDAERTSRAELFRSAAAC